MKAKFNKLENKITAFAIKSFNEEIKPDIIKAMRRKGIKRIVECNNYIFFDMVNGESIIDSKFNGWQENFYEKYIYPLMNGMLRVHINIDINQ